MKNYFRLITLIVLSAYTTSCSTIFSGTSESVSIQSEPSGAKVYINGNYVGNTPLANVLKRDKDYNVMVKKDGYEPANAVITRSFNAVAILNLLSILCWVVDIVSGALWKFDQTGITVTLEKSVKGSTSIVPGKVLPGEGMSIVQESGRYLVFPKSATGF